MLGNIWKMNFLKKLLITFILMVMSCVLITCNQQKDSKEKFISDSLNVVFTLSDDILYQNSIKIPEDLEQIQKEMLTPFFTDNALDKAAANRYLPLSYFLSPTLNLSKIEFKKILSTQLTHSTLEIDTFHYEIEVLLSFKDKDDQSCIVSGDMNVQNDTTPYKITFFTSNINKIFENGLS